MSRLCLVEDDPSIGELVAAKLRREHFDVDVFDNAEAIPKGAAGNWDLFIIDILLRGEKTGLDLCRQLRSEAHTVPILMLSALSEPGDRVQGLKSGADDYLTKPFETEELLLRVQGMLKRRSWYGVLPQNQDVFKWDGNSINFVTFEGSHFDQKFSLTQKECMLMKLLIEKENQVVSRDEILDSVWGYSVFPSQRTVDNFILRLRKLFEREPANPEHLHSVRGRGYKFTIEKSNATQRNQKPNETTIN